MDLKKEKSQWNLFRIKLGKLCVFQNALKKSHTFSKEVTSLSQIAALKIFWENSQHNIHYDSLQLSPLGHVFELIFHKFTELLFLSTLADDSF